MSAPFSRMTAEIEGPFVVFLIGARIHRMWNLPLLFWFVQTMPTMVKELEQHPETGFLGSESWLGRTTIMVQYWRSMDQLMTYARNPELAHFPRWVEFNRRVRASRDIGIWHETYQVAPQQYECIYTNMPAFGLGKASHFVPAQGKKHSARGRLGQTDGGDLPKETEAG